MLIPVLKALVNLSDDPLISLPEPIILRGEIFWTLQ
jgi:hypothetical protein